MYTVASPDPNPREGGQLPNPNECNSTLTSGTSGIMYTRNTDVQSLNLIANEVVTVDHLHFRQASALTIPGQRSFAFSDY